MTSTARKLPVEQPAPARKWDHRKWGTLVDPIHKSHLGTLLGSFSCTEQFRRDRQRELERAPEARCWGKPTMGTARHETISRAFRNPSVRDQLLSGNITAFTPGSVRKVLLQEYDREANGRQVIWSSPIEMEEAIEDSEAMLLGLFADLHKHVKKIELVEAGFIAKVGDFYTEGHMDLVYRNHLNALGYTDWKTGSQRAHQLTLDHGYESGFYSNALKNGIFLPTDVLEHWRALARGENAGQVPLDLWDVEALGRAISHREAMHIALRGLARRFERDPQEIQALNEIRVFGEFPEELRLTHLPDYIPYARGGNKSVERPEELDFWGLTEPGKVAFKKGQQRGPAWYRVRRTEHDVARLEKMLRGVVAWVRMGHFVADVGEKCTRCSYRESCLNDGYELRGDSAKELARSLKGIDFDGLGEA